MEVDWWEVLTEDCHTRTQHYSLSIVAQEDKNKPPAARLDFWLIAGYLRVVCLLKRLSRLTREDGRLEDEQHNLPAAKGVIMNDLLVILAISVIIIGFLILVGVALWLAAERRRHLSAGPTTATRQPAVQRPATGEKPAEQAPANPSPAGDPPPKEGLHSGEYPSAALYDQTLLPQPPKRRSRHQTK
jgi:hypothetical protein